MVRSSSFVSNRLFVVDRAGSFFAPWPFDRLGVQERTLESRRTSIGNRLVKLCKPHTLVPGGGAESTDHRVGVRLPRIIWRLVRDGGARDIEQDGRGGEEGKRVTKAKAGGAEGTGTKM